MKSYFLVIRTAWGAPKPSVSYIVASRAKSLMKTPDRRKNYPFPAEIQALNYGIVRFFWRSTPE